MKLTKKISFFADAFVTMGQLWKQKKGVPIFSKWFKKG